MKKLILAFAVTIPLLSACGNGGNSANDQSDDVHGAWAYMQLFVEEQLRSPGSAEFPFGGYRHVTPLGNGRYQVQSYVDSQNAYGAQIRTQFEGVIRRGNEQWELESLTFE